MDIPAGTRLTSITIHGPTELFVVVPIVPKDKMKLGDDTLHLKLNTPEQAISIAGAILYAAGAPNGCDFKSGADALNEIPL